MFIGGPRMLNDLHGAELHGGLDKALRKYVRADLLVVDDFAVLVMDPSQAKLAFQVISERYDHRRSTAITTNRPFKDWTKVFPDALNAQVIAERLTERAGSSSWTERGTEPNSDNAGASPTLRRRDERTIGPLPSQASGATQRSRRCRFRRRTVSKSPGGSLVPGGNGGTGPQSLRRQHSSSRASVFMAIS